MRITASAKEENRNRILEVGRKLFLEHGYSETTTRDIAAATGMAAGTLFNYFPNKESLAMTIIDEALKAGSEKFQKRLRGNESLVEELFALVAAEMRELRACRPFVGAVLETAFSPFGTAQEKRTGDEARERHLETVASILIRHDQGESGGVVTMHLYWTLYLGVLAFWSKDESPKQENTLAVLDQSVRLFANTVFADEQTGGN